MLGVSSSSLATPSQPKASRHTVYAGQTLGAIARRYNVSIDALCHANGISRRSPIKPGQRLLVPPRGDKGGKLTRSKRSKGLYQKLGFAALGVKPGAPKGKQTQGKQIPKKSKASVKRAWKKYRRPARRAGYVKLAATGRRWEGYAIIKGNRLSSRAKRGFRRTLYSWRTGKERDIDPRLMRILAAASDTFGGRTLRIASGYREHSHRRSSKHKLGRACDFSIDGIPNHALKEYLMTLPNVGVGYYPNSSFVHVDVRDVKTHWVDLSRPGQKPRYAHKQRKRAKVERKPTSALAESTTAEKSANVASTRSDR